MRKGEAACSGALDRDAGEHGAGKSYQRAHKKYYARVMKGNMTRDEFSTWVEHAAAERDCAIGLLLYAAGS